MNAAVRLEKVSAIPGGEVMHPVSQNREVLPMKCRTSATPLRNVRVAESSCDRTSSSTRARQLTSRANTIALSSRQMTKHTIISVV
eukprot:9234602-Pyramimonas_sp.AAC.1